jgi:cytochrome c551/c552
MKAWSAIGEQGPPTLAYTCEFVYMYSMLAKMLRINTLLAAAALAASLLWPALSRAAELVMFEQGGCVWCAWWNREVGPVYDKTAEAKVLTLRRIDIGQQTAAGVTLAAPVIYTPTFVVVDNGREIGRITGFINNEAFWGLLDTLAAKLERPPEPKI